MTGVMRAEDEGDVDPIRIYHKAVVAARE